MSTLTTAQHKETADMEISNGNADSQHLFQKLIDCARIPEHSPGLMHALSQGNAFCVGEYFFIRDDDWLMAIAYPLQGSYSHKDFEIAFEHALHETRKQSEKKLFRCFAIGQHCQNSYKTTLLTKTVIMCFPQTQTFLPACEALYEKQSKF